MAAFDVDGLIGRVTQRMAATPWFAQLAPKVVPPLDRTLRCTGCVAGWLGASCERSADLGRYFGHHQSELYDQPVVAVVFVDPQ